MAKSNVTNLTAHRNTLRRRKRKEAQQELVKGVRRLATSSDCRAYAVVVFDDNGEARTMWDTGRMIPEWAFPKMIEHVLGADVRNAKCDRPDDFIPPEGRDKR